MYKLIQNYLEDREYEYAEEFQSIEDADKRRREYEQEDKKDGKYHNYTIIDNDTYEDAEEAQDAIFNDMAMDAMQSIGLTEDEAQRELEDLKA